MKRFLNIIIFLVLGIWSTYGQSGIGTDGYNPDNPGDPQVPEQKYTLTLGVTPNTAGSPTFREKSFLEGERVYVYANNNSDYVFEKWTEGDSVVSTSYYFDYIMPKRNVKLVAHYRYDPDSPADPDSIARKLNLTLKATPSRSGSFNYSTTSVGQGETCRMYAYANTHYDFEGWYEKGKLLSHENPYDYVMGKSDVLVEGKFVYNPLNPSNPGSNSWNAETGMVIVDDFAPNEVVSAIDEAIGGYSNRSNVAQVIVAGNMSHGDWGIANYFENCAIIDLKRTFGYTEVPNYAFDYCANLQNIVLPACVEKINYRAFEGCLNLSEITCYAITPPILGSYAFEGIAEGAVLHVLSSSIPLYSEAEGWNKMTILPLQDEVRTLTVKLPEESADGRYKNMWLELVNQASGQRSKYVVSDRLLYTFNGLLEKETYAVVLRTPQGVELSRVDDVLVQKDDLEVTFSEIKQLKELNLTVMSPSGEDVTAKTKVVWLNEEGKYLKQGRSLNQQTSGSVVKYQVSFDRALGLVYQMPQVQEYLVKEKQNDITLTLDSLTKKNIYGVVKDKNVGTINHAVVTVSQKVNGEFMQSAIAKTDRQGKWNLSVFEAPSTLTFAADDYISKTFEVAAFGDSLDMGTCELRTITGAVIQVKLTYQSAQLEGATSEQGEWYSDYANVGYRIYNETQQKAISAFNVQHPRIVLLEEVEAGDILKLTAYSVKKAFSPVETTAVVDDNNAAEAMVNIVGPGTIQADFASTENANVSAILYNAQGELVEQMNYANGRVNFGDLSQGKYTLVSMAKSNLFNSIARLSQLQAAGLVEGSDFVQNEVEVKDGLIQKVHNDVIPVLDESKLYYTGQQTSFSVNKSNITAGNYLTLAGKIDFKEVYSDKVSDVKLVVDLPQHADFVENSVMVGSELAQYALEGKRITVPLGSYYYDKIRFCVIPTLGGEFRPSAFVEFTMDGKTVLQPIGSAFCEVKDLSINVPSVVAKNEIPVSGTAMAHSQVTIYDGNQVIGETKALGNGLWNAVCQFDNPYNLSKHEVYALIKTKQGLDLKSETKNCAYNKNAIRVNSVLMSFYNGWEKKNKEVLFDFANKKVSPSSYSFYVGTDLTFVVDFTNNDPKNVHKVVVCVFTDKNEVVQIPAIFDEKINKWVAIHRFESNNLPVNLSVKFLDSSSKIELSSEQISDSYGVLTDVQEDLQSFYDQCDEYKNQIENELAKETFDFNHVQELYGSYFQLLGIEKPLLDDNISVKPEDIEKIQKQYDEFKKEYDLGNLESLLSMKFTEIDFSKDLNDSILNFKTSTCDGYVESQLDSTYTVISTTEHFNIYVKCNGNETIILDFHNNVCYHISLEDDLLNVLKLQSNEDFVASMRNYISSLYSKIEKVREIASNVLDIAEEVENHLEGGLKFAREGHYTAWRTLQKLYKAKSAGEYVNPIRIVGLKLTCEGYEAEIRALTALKGKVAHFNSKFYKSIFGVMGIVSSFIDCKEDLEKFIDCYYSVPMPCENDQAEADGIQNSIRFAGVAASLYYIGNITSDICALLSIGPSVAAAPATGGSSFGVALVAVGKLLLSAGIQATYQWSCNKFFDKTYIEIGNLECYDDPDDPDNPDDPDDPDDDIPDPSLPPVDPIHDPSGYVYEAVHSNRVEGVTASCYYKEYVEDMYGDKHENIVLWNAEDYAQKNPLFTDENGMYRWDVPQGLWQVKFEKEGYQTTYSDWLPVPPPQLEVNVPISQLSQPSVENARAYEEGIEIQFSKYMDPATLDLEHVKVTKNDSCVAGTISMVNAEKADKNSELSYVSKVRFVPDSIFLGTDKVTLVVSRMVKSYAGIPMAEDYTQEFDIVREIKAIAVDSTYEVVYGKDRTITVSVLPADAAVGKKMVATSSSPLISTVTSEAVLDENSQAQFVITGELPGTAMIDFSMEDVSVKGQTLVNVVAKQVQPNAPTASRASGTEVFRNTTIELSSDIADAKIFYTLDGSCPCDSGAVLYQKPIVIDKDITIKAMVVDSEGNESDIVQFVYKIKRTNLGLDLAEGWSWISHNMESPLKVQLFEGKAERVQGQTGEVVDDPKYGLVGDLLELDATAAYKVQAKTASKMALNDYQYNARDHQITLESGWNWMGYPMSQTMSVDEAFANASPALGDLIVGLSGQAEYTAEGWKGSLKTLVPGQGYLYKAIRQMVFGFNTNLVSKAASLYAVAAQKPVAPWAVDIHAYPNVMPMTVTLQHADENLNGQSYDLGAFSGTECRGIGVYEDGRWFVTVHGEGDEIITFKAIHKDSEESYDVRESLPFVADNVGAYVQPYRLNFGESTGIADADQGSLSVSPRVAESYVTVSLPGGVIDQVSITTANGKRVMVATACGTKTVMNVSDLSAGVYVVTVVSGDKFYYKKMIKK